jgi:hypothetical protein
MPLTELDTYQVARMLIDRHGADAVDVATREIEKAVGNGNSEAMDAWNAIRRKIEELQEPNGSGEPLQ